LSAPAAGDLVVITPAGGYVAPAYTHFVDAEENRKIWVLNPFEFFGQAFATDELPKPGRYKLESERGHSRMSFPPFWIQRHKLSTIPIRRIA